MTDHHIYGRRITSTGIRDISRWHRRSIAAPMNGRRRSLTISAHRRVGLQGKCHCCGEEGNEQGQRRNDQVNRVLQLPIGRLRRWLPCSNMHGVADDAERWAEAGEAHDAVAPGTAACQLADARNPEALYLHLLHVAEERIDVLRPEVVAVVAAYPLA